MHAHTLRRRVVAASAGLAAVVSPFIVAATAEATPSRTAAASVDTTYLSDTLGLPANTVVETVTYDRFQWLLKQSGQFAFVIGSATDANFKVNVQAADLAAKAAGATKIYWFDPNLTGQTGIKNLDTRNPAGINLVAASQTTYGNVWKNVLGQYLGNGIKSVPAASETTVTVTADDTVINDSVNPIWDYRSTGTPAVTTTDDIFFVYDKDHKVADVNDKIVDWTNLSTAANATAAGAGVTTALTTAGGGAVIDQLSQFAWWKDSANHKHDLAYPNDAVSGGDILDDSDNVDGWRVQQITYPELLHVLQTKDATAANFVLLFGGTWCHNTRAVVKFINQQAQDNGVQVVYNFDLVLDGGTINGTNGGGNAIHVRDNANSGTTFNFRPSWVYGDLVRTYFKNLITEYDPQNGTRVSYYPGGDLTAFPDVVRKLQVPFLIGYQRGTAGSVSSTAIKRQWIQQTTDIGSGLPTFKEYMTEWWFTQPSAQLGLNFPIPADESTLTTGQKSQLATARLNLAFGQEAVQKVGEFFKGLPGAVNSTQTVTAPSVTYGNASAVTLAIQGLYGRVPTGTATLTVNGASYPVAVAQNAAVFTTAILPVGTYPYSISYTEDAQIKGFTKTGSLEVTKAQVASVTGAATTVPTASATGTYHVAVTEPSGLAKATGDVAVTFTKGTSTSVVNGTVADGVANITIPTLASGTWAASVAYAGDGSYFGSTADGSPFTVAEAEGPVKADVTTSTEVTTAPTTLFGGTYHVTVGTPDGEPKATGDVTLTLTKGTSVRTTAEVLVDGQAELSIPALGAGTWTASVAYSGDGVYAAKSGAGVDVIAAKTAVTATTSVVAPTPQGSGSYTVNVDTPSLAKAAGGVTVTLTKGAATQVLTGSLTAGTVTLTVPALAAGTWTASVDYAGDSTFAAKTVTGTSVVSAKNAVSKVTGAVSTTPTTAKTGKYKVTVTQPSGLAKATGAVTVSVKHGTTVRKVTGTLASGIVTVTVPKLVKGTWTVSVAYAGDANYAAKTAAGASINVTK